MKLESVRIRNFRTFGNDGDFIPLDGYTCFVGPNGVGKSNVFTALNVLFRYSTDSVTNLTTLEEEDFHQKDTSNPVEVTAVFTDLSAEAQADFANCYRQGKLIISAIGVWDPVTRTAPVKQYGERLVLVEFAPFFKAEGDGVLVPELRQHYTSIRSAFPDLPPPGTKAAMIDALRDYENKHPNECKL